MDTSAPDVSPEDTSGALPDTSPAAADGGRGGDDTVESGCALANRPHQSTGAIALAVASLALLRRRRRT